MHFVLSMNATIGRVSFVNFPSEIKTIMNTNNHAILCYEILKKNKQALILCFLYNKLWIATSQNWAFFPNKLNLLTTNIGYSFLCHSFRISIKNNLTNQQNTTQCSINTMRVYLHNTNWEKINKKNYYFYILNLAVVAAAATTTASCPSVCLPSYRKNNNRSC